MYTYCKIKCNWMLLKRSGLLTAEDRNRNVGLGPVIMRALKKYQQYLLIYKYSLLVFHLYSDLACIWSCAIKSDLQPSNMTFVIIKSVLWFKSLSPSIYSLVYSLVQKFGNGKNFVRFCIKTIFYAHQLHLCEQFLLHFLLSCSFKV